jgi:hypothetical protein
MSAEINVPIQRLNPGSYLAACGLVEIVGAFDRSSVSHWVRRNVMMGDEAVLTSTCIIRTDISEAELATEVFGALSETGRWAAITLDGRGPAIEAVGKDEPVSAVRVSISLRERIGIFPIDYWYHQLPRADDDKLKEKMPRGKSVLKFWGGRMSPQKTLLGEKGKPGLITALAAHDGEAVQTITQLLSIESETGSSLNLDAAARRGALDRGLAANEAKRLNKDSTQGKGDVAASRPALELLAAVGLSAFFPPRRLGEPRDNGIHSTAGFTGFRARTLAYCLWATEVPLPLARLLARGVQVPGAIVLERLAASRVPAGGKLYRFDYARGAGSALAANTEEENDVGTDADEE